LAAHLPQQMSTAIRVKTLKNWYTVQQKTVIFQLQYREPVRAAVNAYLPIQMATEQATYTAMCPGRLYVVRRIKLELCLDLPAKSYYCLKARDKLWIRSGFSEIASLPRKSLMLLLKILPPFPITMGLG